MLLPLQEQAISVLRHKKETKSHTLEKSVATDLICLNETAKVSNTFRGHFNTTVK